MAKPMSSETPVSTNRGTRLGKPIFRLAICIVAVLAAAAVLYAVPVRNRPLSAVLAFLFVVLIVAARWGFRYAVFVSFIAALAFSLLVPPVGRFQIRDLRDVLVLVAFLVIGITTSHFSDRARREALNANQRRAEAVAAQRRFSDLVNSVEGIVWEADAQSFVFSFVSEKAERVLGYPVEQWLREPTFWKDHLHPDDRAQAVQFYEEAKAKKCNLDFEFRMTAGDGRVVWLRDLVTVVENGRGTQLRGVMIDITERRRAEEVRQQLEEQLKAAFVSNPTMYFIVDASGTIASVNTFGAEQLGYSVSELVGQPVFNIFYEPDRDAIQKHAKECFEQPGRMMSWEARKIRKDGSMIWVRETGNAVVLQKRPVLLVVCENITEQKRAEEAARRSENQLRGVIETMPAHVWSTLPDGALDFVNQRWREFTGLPLEDALGWNWETVVHPDDRNRFVAEWRAALKNRQPMESEIRVRRKDGEYRWLFVRNVPLRDELGNIVKWYGTGIDIEDRKRAEALLTGEKRILEMVAKGESLAQILDTLCRLVEEQTSDVLTSILLVDGDRLRHGGAPSLPKAYTEAIDGVVIGPAVGSCGTAAYRAEQVIVEDIATDPLWSDYREVALPHSLRACWSTPILSSQGKVIATFAMYYREPRSPSLRDQEIIEQITHLAGVAIERKLTQEALRRSEAYLAEAQKLSKTGSWALDPIKEKLLHCSEELFRIYAVDLQKSPPAIEQLLERVHPEDRDRVRQLRIKDRDKVEDVINYRLLLPDGTVKYIRSIRHPVFNEARDVVEFMGTSIDVTEQKLAEEALQRSEAYLAEAQRLTKTGSWAYNPFIGKTLFWSDEMFRIFGLDPQEGPRSEKFWQLVHPDDLDRVRERVEREAHQKTGYDDEYRIVLPDGTVKHILDIGRPAFNDAGEVVEFVGTTVDITERKQAEEQLRESEGRFRTIFENAGAGVALVDGQGRPIKSNPTFTKMLGYSEEELRTMVFTEFTHPEDLEMDWRLFREVADGKRDRYDIEKRYIKKDGQVMWGQLIVSRVKNKDGAPTDYMVAMIEDITERKRAEEALRRSEAYLTESQRLTKTGSWAYSPEAKRSIYWSEETFRIFGRSSLPSLQEFLRMVHPEDRESFYERLVKTFSEKAEIVQDYRTVLPDGTVKHIHQIAHPVLDEAGDVIEYVGTDVDVTDVKRAEVERERLRQLEADLAHINRVSMMGELTASLAHEIKQPIAAAVSNAEACLQWLARDQPDLAEVREAATETVNEARRAAEIITRVRALFKKEEITRSVLNVNEVISETVSLVREDADRGSISVRTEFDGGLHRVAADRVQLQQVLMNLMLNGIEAMNGTRGELIIRSQRDEEGRALISVTDAGIGLPVGEKDKIFDAFFTTKPQGTGMGLAISRSIVESHGGRLWAKANSGRGTTFYFTLPTEVAEAA